jgi:methylated-DNA-protein-cysteine methyltransferase-like protein
MSPGFASPPDRDAFKAVVWEIVSQIPPGRVSTYGQIAAMIPPPGELNAGNYRSFGARWVGGAMAACPEDVPWQRVINSQGKISPRPGAERQRQLLEQEGVQFDERQQVDFARYGWEGPPEAWLKGHGLLPPPSLGKRVSGVEPPQQLDLM